MRRTGWTILIAACMLALPVGDAVAQQFGGGAIRSARDGVFTADQAARGRDVQAGMCRSCHTGPTPTPTFKTNWVGRPLSDLFRYLSDEMPKNSPGSLSPEEYTQVLAYLLQAVGLPVGKNELPSDTAALAKIRFDTMSTKPGPD